MVTGCDLLPAPGSIIGPPYYSQIATSSAEDIKIIAEKFLPQGTKFLYPTHPNGADAIQLVDIESDGQDEMLVTYKDNESGNGFGAIVLKNRHGEWQNIWHEDYKINIIGLDWAQFIDITDDKIPELLLGWNLGFEAGYNLDIISFKGTPKKVSNIKYNEMALTNLSGSENERKPEFIITRKDDDQLDDNVPPLVLRWYDNGLVPAKDVYPIYHKERIKALQERNRLYDRNFLDWYYLTEMLVRSDRSLEALESANRALNIIPSHYEKYRVKLETYKAEALIQAEKYVEGKNLLNDIIYKDDINQISCTQDELAEVYLNLGRAYKGLKDYKTAKIKYSQSYNIIKSTYEEWSEYFIMNSFTVKREMDQLEALTKILNY